MKYTYLDSGAGNKLHDLAMHLRRGRAANTQQMTELLQLNVHGIMITANCSHVCACNRYTIQHTTVRTSFILILQIISTAQMMSIGW